MPDAIKCSLCSGSGSINALVSQHDDVKEVVKCPRCNGRGVNYQMTEEERDYYSDYW